MKDENCKVDGCLAIKTYRAHMCSRHYHQYLRESNPECSVDGCDRGAETLTLCAMHYQQHNTYGITQPTAQPMGRRPPRGTIDRNGYRVVVKHGHPNANQSGRMMEHRFVMSEMLGRPLVAGEEVHHLNGDRLDNRPENLELWSKSQPGGQRVIDKLMWAKEILALYENDENLLKSREVKQAWQKVTQTSN